MAEAENTQEQAPQGKSIFYRFFTRLMPIEQRALLGTLVFFAIILLVGWAAINEGQRMRTFTAQYDGRSIERGGVLYRDNCSSCHGVDGRGLAGVGPAINAPDMFDGTRLAEIGWAGSLHDYVELTISAGRPVMSAQWPQPMPTWSQEYGGPLRPDQVRDLTNFVMNYALFYEEGYEGPVVAQPVVPVPAEPAYEPVGTDMAVALLPGDPVRGEALFSGAEPGPDGQVLACNACHSLDGSVLVGPSVQGIGDPAGLPPGYDSLEYYLHESIVLPGAYLVPGFENIAMPANFGDRLDLESLSDLVAYLLTLR